MRGTADDANVFVVDASVVAPAVADRGPDGVRFRQRLHGEQLAAPDLRRIEVLSVIPRQLYVGTIDVTPAEQAVTDFAGFPLAVYPAAPLLFRCWQLRDNLIAYDACSSALAESLECRLLTADTRRSRALGEVLVLVRDWVIGALDRFGRSRSVSRNSSGWTAGDR